MSDDTSRTNGFDDEHSTPGSMGHYSSYHQAPFIDSLAELLGSIVTGMPADIVIIELDEDSLVDPLPVLMALASMGINPLEALEILESFLVMTAPLSLAENTLPVYRTPERTDTGYYSPYYAPDEHHPDDIDVTARQLGIPLPVRHVNDEDTEGPIMFTPVSRPGSIGDIASRTTDRSRGVFHRMADHRRARRLDQMRRGELFPRKPDAIDWHPLGNPAEMVRRSALLSQLMSLGSLTPAIDAEIDPEAEDRANTVRAFVEGSRRGLEDAEGTTTGGHLRLVRGSDQGSMPPYIEGQTPDTDGPTPA